MRWKRTVGGSIAGLVVLGAVAAMWMLPGANPTWSAVVARLSLDADEQAAIAACEDPGWDGLVKVLAQDLDVECPGGWFAASAAAYVATSVPDAAGRRAWLQRQARRKGSARRQARAASALMWVGDVGGGHALTLAITAPDAPVAVRDALAREIAWDDEGLALADPALARHAALARLEEGDLTEARGVALWLRADLLRSPDDGLARRVDVAARAVGLDAGTRRQWLDALASGRTVQGPPELVVPFRQRGASCASITSAECVALIADLLEATAEMDQPGGEVWTTVSLPSSAARAVPLWQLWFEGDAGAVMVASAEVGRVGAWVASLPEEQRAGAVLAQVAYPAANTAPGGDLLTLLETRRGPPWTAALGALVLADAGGVDATVYAVDDGVVLGVGEWLAAVGACGAVIEVPDRLPEPVSEHVVLALAALEAATEAASREQWELARALAVLASRLDPATAGALEHFPVADDPMAAVGHGVGTLLGASPPEPDGGGWQPTSCP